MLSSGMCRAHASGPDCCACHASMTAFSVGVAGTNGTTLHGLMQLAAPIIVPPYTTRSPSITSLTCSSRQPSARRTHTRIVWILPLWCCTTTMSEPSRRASTAVPLSLPMAGLGVNARIEALDRRTPSGVIQLNSASSRSSAAALPFTIAPSSV